MFNIVHFIKNCSWVRFRRFRERLFDYNKSQHYKLAKSLATRFAQNILDHQNRCTHRAGNYPGSRPHTDTSIVWHFFDDQVWRGICTGCNRKFIPNDSDYIEWRSKRSYNTPSMSGRRDMRDIVPAYNISTSSAGSGTSEFDALSDQELQELINKVREENKCSRQSVDILTSTSTDPFVDDEFGTKLDTRTT